MSTTHHRLLAGTYILIGKQPDGDSVRFAADNPALYADIDNGHRVDVSRQDGSAQLRLEGIDAPELHYGAAAQPLSVEPRAALLTALGFTSFTADAHETVTAAQPKTVRGAILTMGAEANGRPVSYVLTAAAAAGLADGAWVDVDEALLQRTVNVQLLQAGQAYLTVYDTTPRAHRRALRRIAEATREHERGVWRADATPQFQLRTQDDIGPHGMVILPKLFRRATDYLRDIAQHRFSGNLRDWLLANEHTASRSENDTVIVDGRYELRLSDLVLQRNSRVRFQADTLDIVFVSK